MGTKVQALQQWCKKQTDGYRDVAVVNMTSSWKDGLAFCAIIHRYRPDLIDFDSLSKENVFDNNKLAFDVAEQELGIPALLDAPDMVAIKVPDKLSVVTYVSQYYNYFHNKPQLGGPGVKKNVTLKRHQEPDKTGPEPKRQTLTTNETQIKDRQVSMGDKCGICKNKVYLLERHVDNGRLYHRTCFRKSELSPTTKILNKSDSVTSEKQESKSNEKPDFWQRRAEARKIEQVNKTEQTKDDKTQQNSEIQKLDNKKSTDLKSNDSKDKKVPTVNGGIHNTTGTVSAIESNKYEKVTKLDPPKRPVPKARVVSKITDTVEPMDTTEKVSEPPKKSVLNKFVFKKDKEEEKVTTRVPRARVVSKITSETEIPVSKPEPRNRSSAPPKPSRLSESPQLPATSPPSIHKSPSDSPPPLPKNLPPQLSSTSLSPSSDRKSPSPRDISSNISTNKKFSGATSKDSHNSQGITKDINKSQATDTEPAQKSTKSSIDTSKKPGSMNLDEVLSRTKDTSEPVAVLVSPSPEPEDKEVLGGLLRNLANIKRRKDSSESCDDVFSNSKTGSDPVPNTRRDVKSYAVKDSSKKEESRTHKAKSTNFVLGKISEVEVDRKLPEKNKISHQPKVDLSVTDEEPAWKKALQERKKRLDRPASADLLSDNKCSANKTEVEKQKRPMSVDILKEKDERPSWQIEAEKRIAARQSGYVDPEKTKLEQVSQNKDTPAVNKLLPNSTVSKSEDTNNPTKQRISPSFPKKDDVTKEPEKKKVPVGMRFSFNEIQEEKKADRKPPRPPPISPTSPRAFGVSSDVSKKLASTKRTSAPTPPRPPMPKTEIKTFGDMKRMSPQEIQRQLVDIDSRLTGLEIRGRQLEESIRKAHDESEDEKMMIEWFNLVNEKNEMVRMEADLIYVSRAQELEDEQHEIDRKIRELINKPEDKKTDADREEEEMLVQKLLDIVNQRSLIVDCQDEDRIRYEEEDRDIAEILATKEFCKIPTELTKEEKKAEKKKKKKKKDKKGKLL